MKAVKIDIEDLISILETLRDEEEVKTLIIGECEDLPAMSDADNPDTIYVFANMGDVEEDQPLH